MSLGEAFIDIRARTAGFRAELEALQPELDKLQARTNAALSGAGARGGTASAAQTEIAKAAKAAAAPDLANEIHREIVAAEELRTSLKAAYETGAIEAAKASEAIRRAENKAADARFTAAAKRSLLEGKNAAIERLRATAAETQGAADAKRLEKAINAQGRLGEAEAKAFGNAQRAEEALTKAREAGNAAFAKQADLKAKIAGIDAKLNDAEARRSAALSKPASAAASVTAPGNAAAVEEAAAKARGAISLQAARERAANEELVLAAGKAAGLQLVAEQKAADAARVADQKAASQAIEADERAHQKAMKAIGNLYRTDAKTSAARAASEAKDINARVTAEAKAAAAAQRDIAAQLQNSLTLLRQRQTDAAKAAAEAETTIAKASADRQAAIASELQNRLALLRQRQAAETKAAYDAETAAAERAAVAQKASAAAAKAGIGSGAIGGDLSKLSGVSGAIGGAASKAIGAIGTTAKFATIGVLGLGAALVAIGLEASTKVQNARVSFEALAANISVTGSTADEVSKKVDALNASVGGLSDAERKSIGDDFTQQLINIANTSTLAQSALFDTSQQLLALGFNGQQAKDIILTFGNALAASGKSGGALNDDLKGVVVAISQIQGAGRLLAQDLNQITTRIPGISRSNVYKQIAADTKHLGDVSKVTAGDIDAVRKQLKAGGVDSATATKAILEVTQKLPGFKGALERQNQTLSGQIDALKDNVRNALANLFAPAGGAGLTDKLAKQVGQFSTIITKTLTDAAPKFQSFVTSFADTLIAVLPPLVTLSAKLFGIISDGLAAIAPKIPAIVNGFKSIGEFISRLVTDLEPTLSILVSVSEALIAIGSPVVLGAISGIVGALEALNIILGPIADHMGPVVDAIKSFAGNTVVKTILEIVGAFLAFGGALTGIGALIGVAAAAIEGLTLAVTVLGVAIVANPIGAAVAAVAALAVGFTLAWKASQTFRTIVSDVLYALAKLFEEQFSLMLLAIQKLLEGLATGAKFLGKFIPGIGGLGSAIGDAAKQVGNLRGELDGAVSSIRDLGDSSYRAASSTDNMRQALKDAGVAGVSAGADLVELQSIINALPDEKRIAIEIQISTTIGKQNTDFLNSKGIPLTGLEDATGFSTAGIQDAANKAAKQANDSALKITDGFINGLPTSSGGGGGGAGAKVKSAAAKAADTFRQALKDIVAGLDKDFKDTLTNGTRKQIDTALDSLTKKIAAAFKAAGRKRPTKLLDDIQADNKKLKNLADQRDKLLDKIKAATDRFNEVQQSIKDFASVGSIDLESIGLAAKDATTKLADLSKLRIILPGQDALNTLIGGTAGTDALKASSQRFADALAARLKQITDFQANIKKLIAEGLNKTTIDQIISQGPENGGQLAGALSTASKATIDQINATQKGIDAAAKSLANTAVDSLFRSGEKVVDGLLQGLKDKEKDIVAAMKHIADVLVDEIKKRLKVKSPSRRMADEVGAHIIPGLVAGMDHAPLRSAMADVADTLAAHTPTLAPINLDTLGGLARAEARLQLDAALAPSSVQLLAPPPPEAQRLSLGKDGVRAIVDALANARASKEIHAPVTVHAPAAIADPHATAKVLARAIRSIR